MAVSTKRQRAGDAFFAHTVWLAGGALLLGLGVAIGRTLGPDPIVEDPAELAALRSALADAERALEQARERRRASEQAAFRRWLEGVPSKEDGPKTPSEPSEPLDEPELGSAPQAPPTGAFDEAALIAADLGSDSVRRIRELWEQVEHEKAEVGMRAARQGWAETYRHFRALRGLEGRARRELEDVEYDWYLYATHRPNRVIVRQVLDDTVASRAGLERGDAILRYEGVRIFSPSELDAQIAGGEPDTNVRLEIVRAGRELSFVVPREQLGVLTTLSVQEPFLD